MNGNAVMTCVTYITHIYVQWFPRAFIYQHHLFPERTIEGWVTGLSVLQRYTLEVLVWLNMLNGTYNVYVIFVLS